MTAATAQNVAPLRFRVRAGLHSQAGPDGRPVEYGPGCEAGDVVESTTDLAARFGADKFERLHDGPAVPRPSTAASLASARTLNLDALTLEQLQAVAAEEEIDLRGAKTADEAKKAMRAALR